MKQTKTATRKRPARAVKARTTKLRRRPLHKRILLHPVSVMVLLCAGVLIIGSTFHGWAESYDVTASVPAVPPSSPALISSPAANQHFSAQPIQVSGTCPPASYVKLFRNDVFSGVGLCSGATFHIQTDLASGANNIQAKVFNLTDIEGPISPAITVFYDETSLSPSPPATPPSELQIANIENGQFTNGAVTQTSVNPTIAGMAPPYADIVVTFHSDPTTCHTKADGQGWWSCTLDTDLPAGIHHVDVLATTIEGQRLTLPTFSIRVVPSLPSLLIKSLSPFLVQSEYSYQAHKPGQTFSFSLSIGGGKAPFKVVVDWGDDQRTTLSRSDASSFIVTHTYESPSDYPVIITITDAKGTTSTMQLLAVVRSSIVPVAAVTKDETGLTAVLSELKRYLWIIWPVYIAVVLMVLSFWIGEQEAYRRLVGRKPAHSTGKSKR